MPSPARRHLIIGEVVADVVRPLSGPVSTHPRSIAARSATGSAVASPNRTQPDRTAHRGGQQAVHAGVRPGGEALVLPGTGGSSAG